MTGDPTLLLSVLAAAACGLVIGRHTSRSQRRGPPPLVTHISMGSGDTLVLCTEDPCAFNAETLKLRLSPWAARHGVSVLVFPQGVSVQGVLGAGTTGGGSPSKQSPTTEADQQDAEALKQHAPGVVHAGVAGDLEVAKKPGLHRVVNPLPQAEQKGPQSDGSDRAIGQLQRRGECQDQHASAHDGEQLVPAVDGEALDCVEHGAIPLFKDVTDPRLPDALRAAADGTGPAVTLVGMKLEGGAE